MGISKGLFSKKLSNSTGSSFSNTERKWIKVTFSILTVSLLLHFDPRSSCPYSFSTHITFESEIHVVLKY